MDLSICVALSASWRADFSRNGCRRRLVPSFRDLASTRLTLVDDPSIMPTRVEFSTAVQHLAKALFLSKPTRPPLPKRVAERRAPLLRASELSAVLGKLRPAPPFATSRNRQRT